jgi:hypothetical protein
MLLWMVSTPYDQTMKFRCTLPPDAFWLAGAQAAATSITAAASAAGRQNLKVIFAICSPFP